MTSAPATPRQIHCLVVALVLFGCGSPTPTAPVRVVNLLREMDRADQRPPRGFSVGDYRIDNVAHPAIEAAVPSRLTVPLLLPRRGAFRAFVALAGAPAGQQTAGVRLRIGVSDHRIYEGLTELTLTPGHPGWMEIRTDLSAYAGWKWSVFYRPEQIVWRLVLAADTTDAVPATVLWGEPEIVTDTKSAREYVARRQRLR
jgi:hypothetical protein